MSDEQAVIVYLDARGLANEVYEQYDLATLEDQLTETIADQSLGEFDGNEFSQDKVTLFMYGPDAELLYAGVEPVLRSYPLCQGAAVTIRSGGPDAPFREVQLGAAF